VRAKRSDAGSAGRGYPSPRAGAGASRGRSADRSARGGATASRIASPRSPEGRHPGSRGSSATGAHDHSATDRSAEETGPGTRGALAVAGMFGLTLIAAAADSYIGMGLGTITLVALVLTSAVATWVVRRRDLISVVVAPPLVFVGVALVNIVLAPSATLSLPTLATLLIRGFPAMGLGFGAALVVALGRLVARR
jgi:uncharacterized protein DUF6542